MQLWKNTALTSVAALLGLFLLPLAVARKPAEVPEYTELPRTEQTAPVQPAVKAVYDADRTLRVLDGETVREMTLADYLVGVTAAEMPASFKNVGPSSRQVGMESSRVPSISKIALCNRIDDLDLRKF